MRILFLNQFFWPDTAATGQLLSDLVAHLTENGDDVSVICGSANYGGTTSAARPNVNIIRLKNASFSRKAAGRMGSYLSFLLGALWHGMRVKSPDVVVTLTTPPLLSLVGLVIQKIRGAKHVIWEMDVYPDVAVDLGVIQKNGIPAKIFGWLSDIPRRHADSIIVLGECMRTRLLAHGLPESKIVVAENWADRDEDKNGRNVVLAALPSGPLSILYSGNFGLAHDVGTVSQTMVELDKRPVSETDEIRFIFAGGGSRNGFMQEFCQNNHLRAAVFLPYCEREELGSRIASAHIGLVTQKAECLGSAVPSKTYGILAAGRPVLFIGPKESTPARIIAKYGCGWQIDCGDVAGLGRLLDTLNADRTLIVEAGNRAYYAFVTQYQRCIGVARIARLLGAETNVTVPLKSLVHGPKAHQPILS